MSLSEASLGGSHVAALKRAAQLFIVGLLKAPGLVSSLAAPVPPRFFYVLSENVFSVRKPMKN